MPATSKARRHIALIVHIAWKTCEAYGASSAISVGKRKLETANCSQYAPIRKFNRFVRASILIAYFCQFLIFWLLSNRRDRDKEAGLTATSQYQTGEIGEEETVAHV